MSETAMVQDLARLASAASAALLTGEPATAPGSSADGAALPSPLPADKPIEAGKGRRRKKAREAGAMATPSAEAGAAPEAPPQPAADAIPDLVPPIEARPCFKVFTEWGDKGTDDTGQSIGRRRPGVWYFGVKPGTDKVPPTLTETYVCGPLWIEAVTTDNHGGNFGRLLNLRNTLGTWRTWAMPMELLAGTGEALRCELLAMGLELNLRARDSLVQYLTWETPSRRVLCTLQTGWAGPKFDAFVLPSRVIGPGADGVVFQGGRDGAEYATAGTLEGWRDTIAARAVGNPVLGLALCAAFAGPVLARCNAEGGGVHLVGDSSTGKTTAVEVAASVWGGDRFRRSWRATANGMEGAAALSNDSLLVLDEISECDPRDVGAIVYALGNGAGKQRAQRTGGARAVARWRCMVLSSGERTIATVMSEAGQRQMAGHAVRMLDVPAARIFGAWDTLHGAASGTALSDDLKRAAAAHHGHAGVQFMERLTRTDDDLCAALDAIKARPEFATPGDASGQIRRAAGRFALLALAGELATEYGCTGWPVGEAVRACGVAFTAWRDARQTRGGDLEGHQIARAVRGFIERHGDGRFSDADENDATRAAAVRDRAGWWRNTSGGRVYLFTAEGLREALKGFDFNRATAALQAVGALEAPGADGKRSRTARIGGRRLRVYEVNPDPLETAE
jgi:putative DNA primase/helicase